MSCIYPGFNNSMRSKPFSISLVLISVGLFVAGCRDVGFREIDVAAKNRASVQTARDVMSDLQKALRVYFQQKHHYPATTEAHLYDSIHNDINPPLDPIHLYRNDNGKGYFISIGSRSNRIIYRY